MQSSRSIVGYSFSSMHPSGHSDAQSPHLLHFSVLTSKSYIVLFSIFVAIFYRSAGRQTGTKKKRDVIFCGVNEVRFVVPVWLTTYCKGMSDDQCLDQYNYCTFANISFSSYKPRLTSCVIIVISLFFYIDCYVSTAGSTYMEIFRNS